MTDDELVHRVLAGDVDAFGDIVARHQMPVRRVVAPILHDRVEAENAVQHTFVRAYQRLHQFQSGRDLGRWLKAIARNLVREDLTRVSRESRRMAHYRDYLLALAVDDGTAEEERRFSCALAACREQLSSTAAEALSLRYEESRSLDEIAATMGRTRAAARQLLFRAREMLRVCVEERLAE